MKIFRILWVLLFLCSAQSAIAEKVERDTASRDSAGFYNGNWSFADSFKNDSLKKILYAPFQLPEVTEKKGKIVDPFDPFEQEVYLRRGMGRFWYFAVSMIIIGLFLYYYNTFPNQFVNRVRSLSSAYHFRELIADVSLSFTGGTAVAEFVSLLVYSQLIVVVAVYAGYTHLNSIVFYLVVVLIVSIWKGLLYLIQFLQCYVLNLREVNRMQFQRHVNLDIAFSLLFFPLLLLAYYNSGRLIQYPVPAIIAVSGALWLSFRIIYEFIGLIRETRFGFTSILYFCALEILPHAILLTAFLRNYNL